MRLAMGRCANKMRLAKGRCANKMRLAKGRCANGRPGRDAVKRLEVRIERPALPELRKGTKVALFLRPLVLQLRLQIFVGQLRAILFERVLEIFGG